MPEPFWDKFFKRSILLLLGVAWLVLLRSCF
jgi:hypothetical protein